ncbi:hypothetical protein GEMRC1_011968 [Eukaryota sp. GEM-RC1]
MPIAENDIPKTAVAIPGMAIEFCRASFGLTNIPAIFQNLMDEIFRDHQTFVSIDNIVLAAKSEENFLTGIEKILKLCIKYNIRLAPKKSRLVHFSVPIHLFGFIYQNHQKFLDPDRVKSILELPAPANAKQLKSFLGSVNFMKDFNLYQSWSFLIPLVQLTLNSTKCSITNATPNEIIFGSDTSPRRNLLEALQSLTEPVNVQIPLEKKMIQSLIFVI